MRSLVAEWIRRHLSCRADVEDAKQRRHEEMREEIREASHAVSNAAMELRGQSEKMQRSVDAFLDLVRLLREERLRNQEGAK